MSTPATPLLLGQLQQLKRSGLWNGTGQYPIAAFALAFAVLLV